MRTKKVTRNKKNKVSNVLLIEMSLCIASFCNTVLLCGVMFFALNKLVKSGSAHLRQGVTSSEKLPFSVRNATLQPSIQKNSLVTIKRCEKYGP